MTHYIRIIAVIAVICLLALSFAGCDKKTPGNNVPVISSETVASSETQPVPTLPPTESSETAVIPENADKNDIVEANKLSELIRDEGSVKLTATVSNQSTITLYVTEGYIALESVYKSGVSVSTIMTYSRQYTAVRGITSNFMKPYLSADNAMYYETLTSKQSPMAVFTEAALLKILATEGVDTTVEQTSTQYRATAQVTGEAAVKIALSEDNVTALLTVPDDDAFETNADWEDLDDFEWDFDENSIDISHISIDALFNLITLRLESAQISWTDKNGHTDSATVTAEYGKAVPDYVNALLSHLEAAQTRNIIIILDAGTSEERTFTITPAKGDTFTVNIDGYDDLFTDSAYSQEFIVDMNTMDDLVLYMMKGL